jgi:hypothetical protein
VNGSYIVNDSFTGGPQRVVGDQVCLDAGPENITERPKTLWGEGRLWRAGEWIALLLGGAGCIVGSERGLPLYTAAERPSVDQVATLAGYVATVDGRDVSALGTVFELLPGCHFVETPTQWGGQTRSGGISATTGRRTFVVPMVAAHLVVTDVDRPMRVATVRMNETDVAGRPVRSFPPHATRAEVDACRHWRP